MSSTNFSTGTIIQSTWLNDVNAAVYNTLPTLSSSLKPVAYSGSKSDVGLGNADNTSDVNKPISTATQTALNLKQDASAKDASGGYAGLAGYNINFKNVAGTFTSAFTNTNTAARTYTFPDKNITIAGISDIPTIVGFANLAVITSTQSWTPPAGITQAKITVIDGGNNGSSGTPGIVGIGGNASISLIVVNPAVTYTATVGAGGGGASSFSGTGITTLTSALGSIKVAGGLYGDSLYASALNPTNVAGTAFGQGGGWTSTINRPGAAGAIIIEY